MNKNITYILFVGILVFLNSCIKSDLSHCNRKADLIIKAVNKYGTDITTTGKTGDVLLFTFTDEGKFISKQFIPVQDIKAKKQIPISLQPENAHRYIAWSNITDTLRMLDFSTERLLAENKIKPLKDINDIFSIPADIFYGSKKISFDEIKRSSIIELHVKRAISQIHVTVVGLAPNQQPQDYNIVVANDDQVGLNFNNQILRFGSVKYQQQPVWFEQGTMMGTQKSFRTLPSTSGASKTVLLYKKDKLIASATQNINGQPIAPHPDERVNVLIDLNQDCPDYPHCNGNIEIQVTISNWDEVVEWKMW